MIPRAQITAWRANAPWAQDGQVEQDLVISRAVVELFSDPLIAKSVGFRGGTAFHKLFLAAPLRYSEDIDLMQVRAEPIGPLLDAIRQRLSWLGDARYKPGPHPRLTYRFEEETAPRQTRTLKIEINTRDHQCVLGYEHRAFRVSNPWFTGDADVRTFTMDELLATKFRALYQRKKGRDAFDLGIALAAGAVNPAQLIDCFQRYMADEGRQVTRANFEQLLHQRERDQAFIRDMDALARRDPVAGFGTAPFGTSPFGSGSPVGPPEAAELIRRAGAVVASIPVCLKRVRSELVSLLPGEPWKGGLPE